MVQIGASYRKNDKLDFVFEHRSVQLYAGLVPGGYPRLQALLEPYRKSFNLDPTLKFFRHNFENMKVITI